MTLLRCLVGAALLIAWAALLTGSWLLGRDERGQKKDDHVDDI